jgi:hypothetical protein
VGVAVCRLEIRLAVVVRKHMVFSTVVSREPNNTCDVVLRKALLQIPPEFKNCRLAVALSPGDLACSESVRVPYRSEREIEAVAGSLAESLCAGESAEELAVETLVRHSDTKGARVEVVAIEHDVLERILAAVAGAVPPARLRLITSIPAALANALPIGTSGATGIVDCSGGEGMAFSRAEDGAVAWRAFPILGDGRALTQTQAACESLATSGGEIGLFDSSAKDCVDLKMDRMLEIRFAAAVVVATADRDRLPNLLRASSSAAKDWTSKLRAPLLAACACAAMALLAMGFYFEKKRVQSANGLARCVERERALWTTLAPSETFRSGTLAVRLKKILAEQNEARAANRAPSALAFWSEVAAAMPNPDGIGLTLDTLQLGPGEGRMSGRVSAFAGDPLGHAGQLEKALNTSSGLAAHAEFETREKDIVVRMRLDYRPPDASTVPAGAVAGGKP